MANKQVLEVGAVFDNWVLIEKKGAGGNGEVWHARNEIYNTTCAIKFLKTGGQEKIERFKREIEIIKNNNIVGVVPVIDFHIPDNINREYAWYSMPLAIPFDTFTKDRSIQDIAKEFLGLIETLKVLHKLDISHRDIKPDNFLYYKERLCLADFGLAKTSDSVNLTPERRDVGAKFTMAPEMRRTSSTADGKLADIFSLAKSLWIALTKQNLGFDGQYNPSSSLALSNFHPNIFFAPLDEFLSAATQNSPELRPSLDDFSSSINLWLFFNENFHERNQAEWKWFLNKIFPVGTPKRAEWKTQDDIVNILLLLSKNSSLNHMFYPDGGGNDLSGVSKASESGLIALHIDEESAELIKPLKLCFESFGLSSEWNYFWLEADNISSIGVPNCMRPNGFAEDLTEISPGFYGSIGCWQNNGFNGEPLPEGARCVTRYSKGAFVFFCKRSTYNLNPSTYDGRHFKMGEEKFREYIEKNVKHHYESSQVTV